MNIEQVISKQQISSKKEELYDEILNFVVEKHRKPLLRGEVLVDDEISCPSCASFIIEYLSLWDFEQYKKCPICGVDSFIYMRDIYFDKKNKLMVDLVRKIAKTFPISDKLYKDGIILATVWFNDENDGPAFEINLEGRLLDGTKHYCSLAFDWTPEDVQGRLVQRACEKLQNLEDPAPIFLEIAEKAKNENTDF
jgi:hypothetical protein